MRQKSCAACVKKRAQEGTCCYAGPTGCAPSPPPARCCASLTRALLPAKGAIGPRKGPSRPWRGPVDRGRPQGIAESGATWATTIRAGILRTPLCVTWSRALRAINRGEELPAFGLYAAGSRPRGVAPSGPCRMTPGRDMVTISTDRRPGGREKYYIRTAFILH